MEAVIPSARRLGPRGRVRLRTLLMIRWIGIAGQAAALILVRFGLGYPLPFFWATAAVAVSAAVNLWLSARQPGASLLSDRWAAFQLGYDMLQLAVLLFLTGGLANPFAVLILAPVTVSATVLSRRSTFSLSLLALGIVATLGWRHLPLPWPDQGLRLAPMFVFAFAVALGLSVIFIAAYVLSVVEEARRLSDALSATQMALDRERQLSAVGGLAAAAAHELGTPLGTIALVAHEIARDLPKESPLAADAALLLSQSKRCREILGELTARPGAERRALGPLPMAALIEAAAAPYRRKDIAFRVETSGDLPAVAESPELSHGLGTLLQNAFEFARSEVVVHLSAEGQEVKAAIADDGPGFDPALLEKLGEPYVSRGSPGRGRPGEHMGLGVFIALTLLERTGAALRFGNRPVGGSEVVIVWRRARLEEGV